VRQIFFVCGLVMALCSIGSTVVAATDAQTSQGASTGQAVTTSAPQAPASVPAKPAAPAADAATTDTSHSEVKTPDPAKAGLTTAAAPVSQASKKNPESFQKLDGEADSVMREVLDLSSDIAILDEQQNNPPQNQLVVLVTLQPQPSNFFELDTIELTIDNEIVAAHPYNEQDMAALTKGGGHRLYMANLPSGQHELTAVFVAKIPRDPDYRQEASYDFISGVNRTLLELYINNGKNNGYPQLTIREWD